MIISSQHILLIVGFALLAGIIMLVTKSNHVKGWFGELIVNLLAWFFLDKKIYHRIKNVTLPTEDSTTQIDHIIVSKYGIFVVETKNMKGWIFGSEHNKEWIQQIYKHKNKFQNPLRQNYRHTKALEEILGLMPNKIFSVVVFVGGSTFKTEMPENVTNARGYIDYIKSKIEPLLGEFEVYDIIKKIKGYRLDPGLKTHKLHIQNLENQHSRKIKRKLRRARRKPTSLLYKMVVLGAVLLVFGVVSKKTLLDKPDESIQQTEDFSAGVPREHQEESPTQKELNKIYQHKDAQGKTHYTNVASTSNAKLVDENIKFVAKPLPIEISGNKVLIPATLKNKGTQMDTVLMLDENSSTTILPMTTADLIEAGNLGPAKTTTTNGETVKGEKRKVRYFTVGTIMEHDFVFLAIDGRKYGRQGVLGMDFKKKHPFTIDKENQMLIWK